MAIGDVPRNQWLKMHSWYDAGAGLIWAEVRILETDSLVGQVSMESVFNLTQAGDIDVLGIGIEETEWQYMDNINLTPEPATLVGDTNGDGDVDFGDYQILEGLFGLSGDGPYQADFDNDNDVDFRDYQLLEGNYGAHLPEPATLGLLLLGGLALLQRRRI